MQRLRQMALVALRAYDLDVRRVRLIANHLNAIFRMDTHDQQTVVLRVSHPTWRTQTDLESELAWLAALARDTDLGAPVPRPTRGGALMTTVTTPGMPHPGRCAVLSWRPGRLLAACLSEANLYQLGILSARLHAHAARFVPPPGFTTRQMSGIYARDEPDLLCAAGSAEFFTAASRQIFDQVRARVDATFAALYADPAGRRVIHNDLNPENVKVFRGRLSPLDFEDVVWGYPVQDIAMTFFDLLFYTQLSVDEYRHLRAAFQQGYIEVNPWPATSEAQIDTFIAGRQIWRANYVARFEPESARRVNDGLAPHFRAFLETGALLK